MHKMRAVDMFNSIRIISIASEFVFIIGLKIQTLI